MAEKKKVIRIQIRGCADEVAKVTTRKPRKSAPKK